MVEERFRGASPRGGHHLDKVNQTGSSPVLRTKFAHVVQLAGDNSLKMSTVWVRIPP